MFTRLCPRLPACLNVLSYGVPVIRRHGGVLLANVETSIEKKVLTGIGSITFIMGGQLNVVNIDGLPNVNGDFTYQGSHFHDMVRMSVGRELSGENFEDTWVRGDIIVELYNPWYPYWAVATDYLVTKESGAADGSCGDLRTFVD